MPSMNGGLHLRIYYPSIVIDYEEGLIPVVSDVQGGVNERSPHGQYAVHTPYFTLVPDDVYDETWERDYLTQLGMSDGFAVRSKPLPDWRGQLITGQPPGSVDDGWWPVWEILLQLFYRLLEEEDRPAMLVQITPGMLYLMAGEPGQLRFFNQFTFHDPNDALYFILKGLDQWNRSPADTPVWLAGHFTTDSPLFSLLSQYIAVLQPAPVPLEPLPGLADFPEHQYADLRSFAACVSSAVR